MHEEPKGEQSVDTDLVGCVHEVDLEPQVVARKVRRVGAVGKDAANFRGGVDDELGLLAAEESPSGGLRSRRSNSEDLAPTRQVKPCSSKCRQMAEPTSP